MKPQKYYSVICEFVPYLCTPHNYMIVISENPFELVRRTRDSQKGSTFTFSIKQYSEITKEEYKQYKDLNPYKGSYVNLSEKDYRKDK